MLALAFAFKYSSLASIAAVFTAPLYAHLMDDRRLAILLLIVGAVIVFRHKDNIVRLLKGEESRINLRKKPADGPAPEPPSEASGE